MRIALAQINPTIGDFEGNLALIEEAWQRAAAERADLVVFPELTLSGYAARDLFERPAFIASAEASLHALASRTRSGPGLVVGYPEGRPTGLRGRPLWNTAALLDGGRVVSKHRKTLLPTYDVFDEDRYFEPGDAVTVASFRGQRIGVAICEDAWNDALFWEQHRYARDPVHELCEAGAAIIINIAASPFTTGKRVRRPTMLAHAARRHGRPILFVNQVGGHDDLVFDGSSAAFDATGALVARAAELAPDLLVVDVDPASGRVSGPTRPAAPTDAHAVTDALVLGTRDYLRRCGMKDVVLGLSGGVDSAVVACIGARAIGADHVLGVAMPSRYSSEGSLTDARTLARALGVRLETVSVEPAFSAYLSSLAPIFGDRPHDIAEENLQARVRGMILMALSNKLGPMVLSTSNKSEAAVGYSTLYGDMCGGLAPIGDVYKTKVYDIARVLSPNGQVIPEATISKPPSAELRPDQKDEDSLPPYPVLDPLLEAHLEEGLDDEPLVARGFDRTLVARVTKLVRLSEYKRRQMPPALKVTDKAFGVGRRVPIAKR